MFSQNKIEVIPFKDFMCRRPASRILKKIPLQLSICSFLPSYTIKSMLPVGVDPTFTLFLAAGGAVVLIAVAEYLFAEAGYTEISSFVSGVTKFVLPVAAYGTILWFLTTL